MLKYLVKILYQYLWLKDLKDNIHQEDFVCKELAMQENVFSCFSISTTVTHGAYTISELIKEFMQI